MNKYLVRIVCARFLLIAYLILVMHPNSPNMTVWDYFWKYGIGIPLCVLLFSASVVGKNTKPTRLGF